MPGTQVTSVCDHLEVVKGERMEGCTLEMYRQTIYSSGRMEVMPGSSD